MGEVTWSMHVKEKYVTQRNCSFFVRRSCAQVRKRWHDSNSSSIQNTSKLEPSCFLDMELPKALDKSLSYNPCPSTNTKHRVSFLLLSSLFISLSPSLCLSLNQLRGYKHSLEKCTSPSIILRVLFVIPHNPRIIYISFSSAKAFPPPTSSFLYIFFNRNVFSSLRY